MGILGTINNRSRAPIAQGHMKKYIYIELLYPATVDIIGYLSVETKKKKKENALTFLNIFYDIFLWLRDVPRGVLIQSIALIPMALNWCRVIGRWTKRHSCSDSINALTTSGHLLSFVSHVNAKGHRSQDIQQNRSKIKGRKKLELSRIKPNVRKIRIM